MAASHQEEAHNSPPSVDLHPREHGGGFPQQTQTAEVGLQTSPERVSEGLPETASLAHAGCVRIQQESPNTQVHDLGGRLQGNGNQCPGLLLGSSNLVVPPGPSHSSSTGEGFRAADRGDSDLSGVDRSNVVPQLVDLRTEMAPIRLPAAADCLRLPRGSTEELPNLDPLYAFHISGKDI